MAIVLTCGCGRKLQIREEFAGQEGQCPACGRTLRIPPADARADRSEALTAAPLPPPVAQPALPAAEGYPLPRNHGGDLLPDDADFFADAPPEIGPVLSSYTSLRRGKEPWPLAARLAACLGLALAGAAIGLGIVELIGLHAPLGVLFWPGFLGTIGGLIGLLLGRFKHTCTYVGREGVARFTCSGSRDHLATREVFRFRDAAELRTAMTHQYVNGIYQGTNYAFTWTDVGGRKRYAITGRHKSKENTPPPRDAFHFARAAELAWTYYLLEQAARQIELAGGVTFNLGGGRWIRLGPGRLTYRLGGEEEEWAADEIGAAVVDQGVVRVKRVDAQEGWFSSTGVVKFPFDKLANAQLFFHLLDTLVGVRVQ